LGGTEGEEGPGSRQFKRKWRSKPRFNSSDHAASLSQKVDCGQEYPDQSTVFPCAFWDFFLMNAASREESNSRRNLANLWDVIIPFCL
jgi:hypothetical protein